MAYTRKTKDEYILLTNYGYGWEEEVTEETYREIKQRAKEYRENTNAQIKIMKRRTAIKEINNMTRQGQKNEAIVIMKLLKLHENALREFEDEDVINLSESGGILYWLDEKQKEYVNAFETKHNAVVYHVIHSYTEFGELLAFLYVSKHNTEWGYDRDDIKHGIALLYNYGSNAATLHTWISTGSGLAYQGDGGWWSYASYNADCIKGKIIRGDFNGDGDDDIAAFYDYANNTTSLHEWQATSFGFTFQGSTGEWSSNGYDAKSITGRLVSGDFNGDGLDDLAAFYYYGNDRTTAHLWLNSCFAYQGDSGWWESTAYDPQ